MVTGLQPIPGYETLMRKYSSKQGTQITLPDYFPRAIRLGSHLAVYRKARAEDFGPSRPVSVFIYPGRFCDHGTSQVSSVAGRLAMPRAFPGPRGPFSFHPPRLCPASGPSGAGRGQRACEYGGQKGQKAEFHGAKRIRGFCLQLALPGPVFPKTILFHPRLCNFRNPVQSTRY